MTRRKSRMDFAFVLACIGWVLMLLVVGVAGSFWRAGAGEDAPVPTWLWCLLTFAATPVVFAAVLALSAQPWRVRIYHVERGAR